MRENYGTDSLNYLVEWPNTVLNHASNDNSVSYSL